MTTHAVLLAGLENLFVTGEDSDFAIKCQGQVFRVHRALLRMRSPFFKQALSHNSEGARFIEGQTGEMVLDDDDPEIVEGMLRFFYTSDYLPKLLNSLKTQVLHLKMDASIFALAEKYQIADLKALAVTRFSHIVTCPLTPEDFVAVVELVYSTTPDTVRDLRDQVLERHSTWQLEKKLDEYRKCVKTPEAFLDYVSESLHAAANPTVQWKLIEEARRTLDRQRAALECHRASLQGRGRGDRIIATPVRHIWPRELGTQ